MLLRRSWFAYFSDDTLAVELQGKDDYTLEINDDLLEILLNNWISNMHKYHDKGYSLTINEDPDSIFVNFVNDVPQLGLEMAKSFVTDFNAESRTEIVRRAATQGLLELKYLSKEMALGVYLQMINNTIEFKIVFPKNV